MLFSSTIFIFAFLPITLLCYYGLVKWRVAQNILLLLASLAFYAWGEPKVVFIMITSILFNWGISLLIEKLENKNYRRVLLAITIVLNISTLVYYKYLDFAISNANALFDVTIPLTGIALPIGISFYTFQAISYSIDTFRGGTKLKEIHIK